MSVSTPIQRTRLNDITNNQNFSPEATPRTSKLNNLKRRLEIAQEEQNQVTPKKQRQSVARLETRIHYFEATHEVLEGLFIGTSLTAKNKEALTARGITHILSIDDTKKPLLSKLTCKILNMRDDPEENLLEMVPIANKFIEEALKKQGKILVCCHDGNSRSAAIILGYLIVALGYTYEEAFDEVLDKRPLINPNLGFVTQLKYMASGMYKAMQQGITQQFDYWLSNEQSKTKRTSNINGNAPSNNNGATKRTSFGANYVDQTALAHEQEEHFKTRDKLRQVQAEFQYCKAQLQEVVNRTQSYIAASIEERESISRELEDRLEEALELQQEQHQQNQQVDEEYVNELEAENGALKELVEQYRAALQELKREKVEILTQHLDDMERLDTFSRQRDELLEQNSILEVRLKEKDRYLREILTLSEERDQ